MVPAYHYGKTDKYLPADSVARIYEEFDGVGFRKQELDWNYLYVNIHADRDTVMRHRGGGIGHRSTHEYTEGVEIAATWLDNNLPRYSEDGYELLDEEDEGGNGGDFDPEEEPEGEEVQAAGGQGAEEDEDDDEEEDGYDERDNDDDEDDDDDLYYDE
ncbi:hypothetical protein V5O48_018682 [Marasmius crinis-equi]|uniref:DNA primase n=1 Tax=Marasmius crinis-equi TaxID=585013 RepID=A0ABR3EKK7_9AGAR